MIGAEENDDEIISYFLEKDGKITLFKEMPTQRRI